MNNKNISPEEYLRWVAQGHKLAERGLEGVFKLYGARIKAFFKRHRMSEEEASDLLQETFIKIYRSADQYQGQSQVSTWIWAIARHTMLDHLRAKKSTESLDEFMDNELNELGAGTYEMCLENEITLQDCVHRGFQAFSTEHPERASIIRLAVFEEWSIEELAIFLSRTPAATREYLSQCRKRMRSFLEPCRDLLGA